MDSRHAPVPSPATHTQSRSSGLWSPTETDCDSEYNEKDAYAPVNSGRAHRTSRSTFGHAHDSVLSPFSPATSAPPSPGSSISSAAGQKHRSLAESHDYNHDSHSHSHSHRVSYPPRAHLDPEKAVAHDAYEQRSQRSQHRASAADPRAVVYDKSQYHEKGPEDKAWQLLVCTPLRVCPPRQPLTLSVLPLWSLRPTLHRHHVLDHSRNPHSIGSVSSTLLLQPSAAVHAADYLPCSRSQPAAASGLLI